MKKEGLNIHIHLTNRWLYTFIAIGILIAVGVGVYAYGTSNPSAFGHSIGEIATCAANQILKMNSAGNAWECSALSVTETDPTVQSWAKTNNPYLNSGSIMNLNTSRLRIWNSILYSIGVPAGYTSIDTCTTLCNNNRPSGVGSTANMCLYAWTYTSPNWAFSTCAATGSARRNCLCLAMYDY